MITAANGIAFIVAPGLGVWLYGQARALPYLLAAALVVWLMIWARHRLSPSDPAASASPTG